MKSMSFLVIFQTGIRKQVPLEVSNLAKFLETFLLVRGSVKSEYGNRRGYGLFKSVMLNFLIKLIEAKLEK